MFLGFLSCNTEKKANIVKGDKVVVKKSTAPFSIEKAKKENKNSTEIQNKLNKYFEANNGATKTVIQSLENVNK